MKHNVAKKILCLSLAATMGVATFASCGGGGDDSKEVKFWVTGTDAQLEMYIELAEKFNEEYGADHGIKAKAENILASNYMGAVTNLIGSDNGADVLIVADAEYKKWIIGDYLADISDIYTVNTDISLGEIEPLTINRLHYDVTTNTSNPDDPLYALPFDPKPTALYYNKGLMESAGIVVISVDEKDMDAWNAGTIADNYGKKKSDYPQLANVTVPKKGYFRSMKPYYFHTAIRGEYFNPIQPGEVMVFNNRIAMNWDEVEDLAMLFSVRHNPGQGGKSKYGTQYGYFTETWFNYGWTVGGDCLYDLTGNGNWNFGLLDPNPNYIVKEGKTFTGRTGTKYSGGQTVAFYDKMEANQGEVLVPDEHGDYYRAEGVQKNANGYATGGTKAGIWSTITTEMGKGNDSALIQLPSTREAFTRYLKLGCKSTSVVDDTYALEISPNPASLTDINPIYKQFYTGNVLCFVGTSELMHEIAIVADDYNLKWDIAPIVQYKKYEDPADPFHEIAIVADDYNLKWDIAPIVQYKKYEDPADPFCDTVVARGVDAGHSTNASLAVNKRSSKLNEAKTFVKWMCGLNGQKARAEMGFFPTQASLMSSLQFSGSYAPSNVKVFAESLKYQRPGDWWYMPDTAWVEAWCIDLNNNVRNNKKSFADWYSPAIIATNNSLKNYEKYKR